MKKIYRFAIVLLGIISMIVILPSNVYGGNEDNGNNTGNNNGNASHSIFEQSPTNVLNSFYKMSNKNSSDRVQNTDLDTVSSRYCAEVAIADSRFSISRTLCNIKLLVGDYLQYVLYIGLTAATILLIWNGFKLVTASDKDKQISAFKKNFIYIVIGVILLVAFYYIIDVFVSIVNLVAE